MYFNIGMKTVYLEVFQQVFNFPPISTTKGRIAWYCFGPVYWILAFVIAASVPNLSGIVSLVGALFMINFTYSFPGMLYLAFTVQKAAALPGEGFDPHTRVTTRLDNGMKRWVRGFKKSWTVSLPTLIYTIAGLACCGMGIWAAIEGLISVFGPDGTVATGEFLMLCAIRFRILTDCHYSFWLPCSRLIPGSARRPIFALSLESVAWVQFSVASSILVLRIYVLSSSWTMPDERLWRRCRALFANPHLSEVCAQVYMSVNRSTKQF